MLKVEIIWNCFEIWVINKTTLNKWEVNNFVWELTKWSSFQAFCTCALGHPNCFRFHLPFVRICPLQASVCDPSILVVRMDSVVASSWLGYLVDLLLNPNLSTSYPNGIAFLHQPRSSDSSSSSNILDCGAARYCSGPFLFLISFLSAYQLPLIFSHRLTCRRTFVTILPQRVASFAFHSRFLPFCHHQSIAIYREQDQGFTIDATPC